MSASVRTGPASVEPEPFAAPYRRITMTTHRSRPRVRTLAVAAVSLLVLSGCGGSDDDVAADPAGTPAGESETARLSSAFLIRRASTAGRWRSSQVTATEVRPRRRRRR